MQSPGLLNMLDSFPELNSKTHFKSSSCFQICIEKGLCPDPAHHLGIHPKSAGLFWQGHEYSICIKSLPSRLWHALKNLVPPPEADPSEMLYPSWLITSLKGFVQGAA